MAKKILIGVAGAFVVLALAQAGYSFGKHLAERDAQAAAPSATAS